MPARPSLTSIGSLPPQSESAEEALIRAVELQREHGLELLTDGEPRGDMLWPYSTLPGVRFEGGIPRIVGRVRPPEDPAAFVKIRDLEFVQAKFPDAAFKVSLTGPTTFAFAVASTGAGPAYKGAMDPALHDDLTAAIRPIAREVARHGADLQIDDPILSQGMRDFKPALARLEAIASELPRDRASLHVCGNLSRGGVLSALLGLESVSTLYLAFAARLERGNLALLEPRAWRDREMALGAGVVPVQVSEEAEIPGPEAVASLVREIDGKVGPDTLRYVVPDCGLRGTAPALVPKILRNLHHGFREAFAAGS